MDGAPRYSRAHGGSSGGGGGGCGGDGSGGSGSGSTRCSTRHDLYLTVMSAFFENAIF